MTLFLSDTQVLSALCSGHATSEELESSIHILINDNVSLLKKSLSNSTLFISFLKETDFAKVEEHLVPFLRKKSNNELIPHIKELFEKIKFEYGGKFSEQKVYKYNQMCTTLFAKHYRDNDFPAFSWPGISSLDYQVKIV